MIEPTTDEIDRIEVEVGQIMRRIYDAIQRVDLEPWKTTLLGQTGPWLLGMDINNLREGSEVIEADWMSEGDSRLERQEIDDLEIRVVAVSPTVAYVVCRSPDRRWYRANGDIERASTAESWVFVLTDDGWKLHSGQSALFPIQS